MRRHTPGLNNLTGEVLQEAASDMDALGVAHATSYALAHTILINTFGGEFWKRNLAQSASRPPLLVDKPDVRAIHLADLLWSLRRCEGFADFLDRNRALDLESAYYELFAARMLLRASSAVHFVRPVSVRGSDFDLVACDFLERHSEFFVEVKARRAVLSSGRAVRNFLSKHRTQLPASGPGGIFCKLEAVESGPPANEAIAAVSQWLQATRRVDLVFFCWEASPDSTRTELRYAAIDAEGAAGPILGSTSVPTEPSYMAALRLQEAPRRADVGLITPEAGRRERDQ